MAGAIIGISKTNFESDIYARLFMQIIRIRYWIIPVTKTNEIHWAVALGVALFVISMKNVQKEMILVKQYNFYLKVSMDSLWSL